MNWTVQQYKKNRKKSKGRNALVYPSWEDVDKAQHLCNVPVEKIEFKEHSAKAKMQDVLDHQMKKIVTKDQGIITWMKDIKKKYKKAKFEMVFKYGADGSSSHSQLQTKDQNGSNIFTSCLVPLFIEAMDPKSGKSVNIWANVFANSAFGVVPLRWSFEKETTGRFRLKKEMKNSK